MILIVCIMLLIFLTLDIGFIYIDDTEHFYISNALAFECAIILLIYTIVDTLNKGGVLIG